MHRFFVEPSQIQSGVIYFEEEISRQISKVLRLSAGSRLVVLDNSGSEYQAILDKVDGKKCTAIIEESRPCMSETRIRLEMQLCLSQREKFEWMLQKCTEVGVAMITPIISSRTMLQHPDEVREKYPRWVKILREAAEQSGRGRLPRLNEPMRLLELVNQKEPAHLHLVAWEGEEQQQLKKILKGYEGAEVSALIGPEGGFSAEEINQVIAGGYKTVTLGKRILRMETAAVVTAALILYELEEV